MNQQLHKVSEGLNILHERITTNPTKGGGGGLGDMLGTKEGMGMIQSLLKGVFGEEKKTDTASVLGEEGYKAYVNNLVTTDQALKKIQVQTAQSDLNMKKAELARYKKGARFGLGARKRRSR